MDDGAERREALENFFPKPGPIPSVNPEDLRKMLEFMETVQARHPGQTVSVDIRSLQGFGADANILWYRMSMLSALRTIHELPCISASPTGRARG